MDRRPGSDIAPGVELLRATCPTCRSDPLVSAGAVVILLAVMACSGLRARGRLTRLAALVGRRSALGRVCRRGRRRTGEHRAAGSRACCVIFAGCVDLLRRRRCSARRAPRSDGAVDGTARCPIGQRRRPFRSAVFPCRPGVAVQWDHRTHRTSTWLGSTAAARKECHAIPMIMIPKKPRCGRNRPGSTPIRRRTVLQAAATGRSDVLDSAGDSRPAARGRQQRRRGDARGGTLAGARRGQLRRWQPARARRPGRRCRAGSVMTSATSGCTTTRGPTNRRSRSTRTPTRWARTWCSSGTSTTRSSAEGKTMLAHELTHVVQQRSGPVDGSAGRRRDQGQRPVRPVRARGLRQRREGDVRTPPLGPARPPAGRSGGRRRAAGGGARGGRGDRAGQPSSNGKRRPKRNRTKQTAHWGGPVPPVRFAAGRSAVRSGAGAQLTLR